MMKRSIALGLVLGLAFAGAAWTAEEEMGLEKAFDYLKTYEFGANRAPLNVITAAIRDVGDAPEDLRGLEQRLIALAPEATLSGKRYIARQLAVIGTAACVPAMAQWLAQPETVNIALRVLETVPDKSAARAIREVAPKLEGTARVGAINSLARRGDIQAVPMLKDLMGAEDEAVAVAAINALGEIGGKDACAAVTQEWAMASGAREAALAEACLLCAERWAAAAETEQAVDLYEKLMHEEQPGHVRAAALKGLIDTQPEQALARAMRAIDSGSPGLVRVAIGYARDLPGDEVTAKLAHMIAGAPPETAVQVIDALAARGDASAAPQLTAALDSEAKAVRQAAMAGLGKLGDADAVAKLAAVAAGHSEPVFRVARTSLATMPGEAVDTTLLEIAKDTGQAADVREEALTALGARRAFEATGAVLALAEEGDRKVRVAALRALRTLAAGNELPALLDLLAETEAKALRSGIETAIAEVASRIEPAEERDDVLLARLKAADDAETKAALLGILGTLKTDAAFTEIQGALASPEPMVRMAAIDLLGAWPSAGAVDALWAVAKNGDTPEDREAAFEACLKALRNADMPEQKRFKVYEGAVKLADEADEKKMILSGLSQMAGLEPLRMAQGMLDDEGVAAEAGAAVIRIARFTSGAYPNEARSALQAFLGSGDETLRKTAETVSQTIDRYGDYVMAWQVSGPYLVEGKTAELFFDEEFPPEGGEADDWRMMPMAHDLKQPWIVALAEVLGGQERVAYLRTTLHSEAAQQATLELGTNDGVKVWLNGELLHALNVGRPLTPGEDKLKLDLKQGKNTLMLAVYQHGGDWAAVARLAGAKGVQAAIPE